MKWAWLTFIFIYLIPVSLFAKDFAVHDNQTIFEHEHKILEKRFSETKGAIKKMLDLDEIDDKHVPKIGVACSGGGIRACIASLAFLSALEELEYNKAISYLAGLSGSTWCLVHLMMNGFQLNDAKKIMQKRFALDVRAESYTAIIEALWERWWQQERKITVTDLYGMLLSDRFFNGNLDLYLSNKQGIYPITLLTASMDMLDGREYFEVSPFFCGSLALNGWIQTQAFGLEFDKGFSKKNDKEIKDKEERLGLILGFCGAAYAFGLKEALRALWDAISYSSNINYNNKDDFECWEALEKDLKEILRGELDTSDFGFIAGRVNNFTKNMEGSALKEDDYLVLTDGAMLKNFPLGPLLDRNLDLYIICDASSGEKYITFKHLIEYAKSKNIKLPNFEKDKESINNNQACLFYDKNDPKIPIIVYIPNSVEISTFQFQYSEEEFNKVFNDMFKQTTQAAEIICEGVQLAYERKSSHGYCLIN